jgi:hypothetical protein
MLAVALGVLLMLGLVALVVLAVAEILAHIQVLEQQEVLIQAVAVAVHQFLFQVVMVVQVL